MCIIADNTTVSQITAKLSVNLTTASPGTSPAKDWQTNSEYCKDMLDRIWTKAKFNSSTAYET